MNDKKSLVLQWQKEAAGQVDQDEVSRFLSDARKYGDWMTEGHNNMTYAGASDTAITNERKRRSDEMAMRANQVRAWLNANSTSLTPESSSALSAYLDDFRKFQEDSQNSYTHKQKTVQRYGSEEAWSKALRQSGYQEKYGRMSKQDLNAAAAALPDGEEKQWLNDYYGEALRSEADYDHEIAMINWQLGRLGKVYDDFSNTTRWVQDETDEQLNQKLDRYRENYGSPQAVKKQMEQLQTQRYHLEQGKKYNLIPQNEDFTEKAKYSGDGSYLQNMVNNPKTADREDTAKHIFTAADPVVIGGIIDAVSYENVHLMTAEERMIFNYLHNTQGEDAAKEYMDWLQYTLNQRSAMKLNNWVADRTRDIPVLSQAWTSLASVPLRFMGGSGILDAAGQKVVNAITGDDKPVDYNRDAMMISQASSTVRSSVARQLNDVASIQLDEEKHPILASWFNGVGIGDLYSAGMSMVDSSVVAAATAINPIAGQVASALLSASSATDTMLQSAANGATDGQAITAGLAAGFFEWFFEKYEIESLMKQGKSVRTAMLKQGFNEAVGEGATELCNIVTNTWLMAENSDWKKKAEEYLKQNPELDRSQAENLAMMDMVMQVLKASAAGFLTGAVMGGGSAAVKTMAANQQAKKIYGVDPGALVTEALELDPNSTYAQELQKKLDAGEKLTGSELRKLVDHNDELIRQQNVDQLMEGIEPVNKGTTPRQPGSEAISDLVDESVAQLTGAPTNPVEAALEGFRSTGTVTNKQATDILNNAAAVQQLVREAGLKLPETASGKRAAVKEAVSRLAQSETGVDTAPDAVYDEENINGGMNYGQGLQSDDRSGGIGDPSQGVAGVQQGNGSGAEGWGQRDRVAVNSGVLRISDELTTAQQKRGTVTYSVQETTENPSGYEQALTAGRNSDPVNGWCVTPKTADELQENGIRTFMNENGTVGVGIAPDGDIVAVFKNKNGGPRKAMDTMMPIAIEQGGDRLDCYGAGLVKVYEAYGFVPVARVEFNPEYANEGWMPERGTPFIYFMMHNGDSAPTVAEKMGNYPHLSKNELDALPTYSKDDYDAAMAYRDSLIDKRRNSSTESVGAAPEGFTGKGSFYNLMTDQNSQPDRPGDVRPMEIPKTDAQGRHVSEFAANAYGAEVTTDRSADMIQELIAEGALGFDSRSNKELLEQANDRIKQRGMASVEKQITKAVFNGRATDEDIAAAMILYARYSQKTDAGSQDRAAELMVDLATMANAAGRRLQLFSMLRKMTPDGQMKAAKKIVQRAQDQANRKRSKKRSVEISIPQQLQDDFLAAARDALSETEAATSYVAATVEAGLKEDAAAAAENVIKETASGKRKKKKPKEDEAAAENVIKETLADKIGKRVADSLAKQAKQQETTVENLIYQRMMLFANDKASLAGKAERGTSNKNLKTLQEYYQHRAFYQSAWDAARTRVQQTLNNMSETDPRRKILESFLSFETEENTSPVSVPLDYSNPKSTLRRGVKEAATAAGYRMENAAFDLAGSELSAEVRQQMKDVLLENREDQQKAADEIARVAMEGLSLTEDQANAMARDITEAFFADLADRAADRVSRMFTKKETAQKVQKDFSQKLKELYNLGAFDNESYRNAAFKLLFGKDSEIDIPDALMQQFVDAAEDRKGAALDAIYQNAAAQIPATAWEKANAWRYMAMLGNPRTQARNFVGNGSFRGMVNTKRWIGAGLERLFLKQEDRTKSVLGFSQDAKDLKAWAEADASTASTQEVLKRSGLTGDESRTKIQDYRKIYNTQWLESVREFVQLVPESVDMLFKKREYTISLASFIKARGYTAADIKSGKVSNDILEEARTYAAQEAMKATFNDHNVISDFLAKRLKGDKRLERAVNLVVEGILPFRRTPANILARSLEYGPAGLIRGLGNAAFNVKNGKVDAATAIDQIAAGLTGTGMIGLGWILASGIIPWFRIRGKITDDDEKRNGHQEYALEIGNHSFTIDWIAPVCMPLFIGANIAESRNNPDEDAGWILNTLDACINSLEPFLELSCLSAINDVLSDSKYAEDGTQIYSIIASVASSYMGQYIPTLFGQMERALETDKKRVYSDADSTIGRTVEEFIGGVTQKVPIVDLYQTKSYDATGDDNSALNRVNGIAQATGLPFNTKIITDDAMTREISRLNDTQDLNVTLPTTKASVTYLDTTGNRQNRRLTAEEYEVFSRVQGQTQGELLKQLISSEGYRSLNDTQKAQAIKDIYAYAKEAASQEAISDYRGTADAWMKGIEGTEVEAILIHTASGSITDALTGLATACKGGDSTAPAVSEMETAYATYNRLPEAVRSAVDEELSGRSAAFIAAREAGVSSDTFAALYGQYYRISNDSTLRVGAKAQQWSYALDQAANITAAQKRVLKEKLTFNASSQVTAGDYDKMTAAGISTKTANYVSDLMEGIQPEPGRSSVRTVQKLEAITEDTDLSDQDLEAIIPLYLSEGQQERFGTAMDRGYSPEEFVEAYRVVLDKEKGQKKPSVIREIAAEAGITYGAAKRLYEIMTEKTA